MESAPENIGDIDRASCANCGSGVRGLFFVCPQCQPYYLCEPCKGRNVHPQHAMMLVIDPTDLHSLKRLLFRTDLPPALRDTIKEALGSKFKDNQVPEPELNKKQAQEIQKFLWKDSDTATGNNLSTVERKLDRGIPNLYLCSHHDLSFGDTIVAGNEIPSGSIYDGSAVVQDILNIGTKTDLDVLKIACHPMSVSRQSTIIQYLPELPVFCRLDVTHDVYFRENFPIVIRDGRKYLCASSFREFTIGRSERASPSQPLDKTFRESREKIEMAPFVSAKTILVEDKPGSAASSSVLEYAGNTMMVDTAVCIPCDGWPSVARTPSMKGLPQQFRDLFPFGFHIVPKATANGDTETEWRLSFSLAENALIHMQWTQAERSLYAFLKCLVKRHIGMNHVITTYHLKTVMLWHLEGPSENLEYGQRIVALLDSLLHFLSVGNLPMYFVPQMNLWYAVPPSSLEQAAQRIVTLRQSLWNLPDHFCLYKEPLDEKRFEKELFDMTMRHSLQHVRNDIIFGRFAELGTLYKDPHTILYIWQSYLYIASNFAKHSKFRHDTRVQRAMLSRTSQLLMLEIWRNFFEAFQNDQSLGKERQTAMGNSTLTKEVITRGQKVVYFLIFDGYLFSMGMRQWESDISKSISQSQLPHPTIFPVCEEEGIYFDIFIEMNISGVPSFRLSEILSDSDKQE